MKKKSTKKKAQEKIDDFFAQKKEFDPKYVKKIKRLAMSYNIKLGKHRKKFCKKCFADLRGAKTRVKNGFKMMKCESCGEELRWKIK